MDQVHKRGSLQLHGHCETGSKPYGQGRKGKLLRYEETTTIAFKSKSSVKVDD